MLASISSGSFGGNAIANLTQKFQAKFDKADANGDGQVERSEAESVVRHPERLDKLFEKLDTDGDGAITQEEHDAGVEQFTQKLNEVSEQSGVNLTALLLQQFNKQEQPKNPLQLQNGLASYQANVVQQLS